VFVLGRPIQPSLKFVDTSRSLPFWTHKHLIRLERLSRDKHYSLFEHSQITTIKSFITPGAGHEAAQKQLVKSNYAAESMRVAAKLSEVARQEGLFSADLQTPVVVDVSSPMTPGFTSDPQGPML